MINKVSDAYKKHLGSLILGPLIKMVEAVFDLLIPLFMKAIIDLSFNTSNDPISQGLGSFIKSFGIWIPSSLSLNYAIIGGVIILLLGFIGFLTTMVTQYIAARTSTYVGSDIRNALYEKILKLNKKEIEEFGLSKLLTIINSDSYQVQQGVFFFIRLITRAPFIILGSLIISLILDWQIGLVFLSIIPIILFIVFYVMRKASNQYLVIQSKLDNISTKTSDTIEGSKVVRAFDKADYEFENFNSYTSEYQKEAIKVSKLNALINPLTFAIVSLATIGVIFLGSFSMEKGITFFGYSLLPSTIITLVSYLDQIFVTLVLLTNLVTVLTKAQVSKRRCDQVFSLSPSIVDDVKGKTIKIEKGEELYSFRQVSLAYKEGGNNAMSDISFTLLKGQSLGIIGGTGSGKSTLVNLLDRFLDCTEGQVDYKGINIKDYRLLSLRNEIGLVPQKSVLFKGSIRSNMKMSNLNADDETIKKALTNSLAIGFVEEYPDSLDHIVEEGGHNFSGGQKQRLCLARALVKNPEVLILDDSTSALDLLTDRRVRENIRKNYADTTKVIISQRVSTVMDCDLILVLEGGKVIGKGNHDSLMKDCPIYYETYESQTQKEGL